MSDKKQCPDCRLNQMKYLKLFQRWWCSFCKVEIDTEEIIQRWAKYGYQKEEK